MKPQRKSGKVFINGNWVEFKSLNECDRLLGKWKGFTSTLLLSGETHSKINEGTVIIFNSQNVIA